MAKRKVRAKRIKPVDAWAAISEDDPPKIWHVNWHKESLERQDLRHIKVMVVPMADYRRLPKAAKGTP